jgi:hypothetical protein
MQTSSIASTEHRHAPVWALHLSRDLTAVILFCLLGLALSAAWIAFLGGAEIISAGLAQIG